MTQAKRRDGLARTRRLLVAGGAVLLAAACSWTDRREAHALAGPYYSPDGIAIAGYDPVAYFTEGRPVKGDPSIAATHDASTFWFASRENRERFMADPQQYAPQYGGYCAYGMSEGYRATTEPDAFTVHAGKLYLNYNRDVRALWTKERDVRIDRADVHWRKGAR